MADRFWVGGTGNWSDNTNHWSASTGGSPGASLPTSSDNVNFDANSGTGTVTIDVTTNSNDFIRTTDNIEISEPAGTFHDVNVYGNFSITGTATFTILSAALAFKSTTTGKTITTNGKGLNCSFVNFSGVGGGWTLQDDLTLSNISSVLVLTNGTLNTNNVTITFFQISLAVGTKTLNLGSSTVKFINWRFDTNALNLTLNAGTSTLEKTSLGSGVFHGGGLSYYNLLIDKGIVLTIYENNTFVNITKNVTPGPAKVQDELTKFDANQTITGTFTVNGISTAKANFISSVVGTPRTINAASVSLSYCNFQDIVQAGTAAPFTGTSVQYLPSNSGLTYNKWTSPTNVWYSDNVYASAGTGSTVNEETYYRFSIPTFTGYSITGIEVFVEAKDAYSSPTTWTMQCKLSSDGGSTWTALKSQSWSSTTDTVASFGGSTDTWGRGWSSGDIASNTNFIAYFIVSGGQSSASFKIDQVSIQIYTTSGTSTSTSTTSSSSSTSSTSSSSSTSSTSSSSTSSTSSSTSSTSSSSSTSSTSSSTSSTSSSSSTSSTSSSSSTSSTSSSSSTSSTSSSSSTSSTSSSTSSTSSSSTSSTSSSSSTSSTSSSTSSTSSSSYSTTSNTTSSSSTTSTSTSSTSSSTSSTSSTSSSTSSTSSSSSSISTTSTSTSSTSSSTSSTSSSTSTTTSTSTIMWEPDIDIQNKDIMNSEVELF